MLAAGRSSRMGRNKALIPVRGLPLWQRQYQLLNATGAIKSWVSLRREDDWAPPDIPRVFDDGLAGPLGGLLATLKVSSTSHLIALAVDLPALPVSWFDELRRHCREGRGAVGWRTDVEAYEPLAAIYPREFHPVAQQASRRGQFSLQTLIGEAVDAGLLHEQVIAPEQQGWFVNWNRPEDVVPQ